MLEWDPEERISASDTLNHPCLQDVDVDEEAAAEAMAKGNKRAYRALLTPKTHDWPSERRGNKWNASNRLGHEFE
jgi:hypothetical protein